MRSWLSAFLALALWSTSASASHDMATHRCISSAEMKEKIFNYNRRSTVVEDWSGTPARRFIQKYNQILPPSAFVGDRVLIFGGEGYITLLFGVFHEDCVIIVEKFPSLFIQAIRRWAFGEKCQTSNSAAIWRSKNE